ncbi:PQQ-binding-like beta-propeller repeat protein [Isoptericola sp. b515]|uniref:outer membrane protein assembly factor BamB family protein n=1 Tax=Isoptericola sp. b515 TaxID=3064652 RepID=UPI0027143E92|nr:PQQ-binding-like beta-propeller repeat protein [Isoptericola sp. b515]MDO8147858.1 PQQ-binding-like beta-propeller repeat protein [Isoptericola sp. b515]
MPRRPDPVQIDLAPDEGEEDDGGRGPGVDGSTRGAAPGGPGWFRRHVAGPLRARWRAASPRLRVGAVGVTALAVLGTAAGVAVTDSRADAAHAAHMATMPGGVADLSTPLREVWRVATDDGVLAVLPDGVVVTRADSELLAVDTTTGDEVWRHALGEQPRCGPRPTFPVEFVEPVDRLVCLEGAPARRAVVVDAAGQVQGRRDLGLVNDRTLETWTAGAPRVEPGPDGSVAVGARSAALLTVDDADEAATRLAAIQQSEDWQDPVLRLQDAASGAERARVPVELRTAAELRACGLASGPEGQDLISIHTSVLTTSSTVRLAVCGSSTAMLPDGSTVDGLALPSVDGGWNLFEGGGTRLTDASGRGDVVVRGYVFEPMAVDSRTGPRFARSRGGLTAYDSTGQEVWSADVGTVHGVLARAGGTVVAQVGSDAGLVGIDVATGAVRWARDDLRTTGAGPRGGGVVTDGTLVLLPAVGADGSAGLLALDLADGTTRWHTDAVGTVRVAAIGGSVVRTADDAIVGLAS